MPLEIVTEAPPLTSSAPPTASAWPFTVYRSANDMESTVSPMMSLLSNGVAGPAGNWRTTSLSDADGAPPADQLPGSDQVDDAAPPLQTCVAISRRPSSRSIGRAAAGAAAAAAAAARTALAAAIRGARPRERVMRLTSLALSEIVIVMPSRTNGRADGSPFGGAARILAALGRHRAGGPVS